MVRPDRVELPTFWFVAMNARGINKLQGYPLMLNNEHFQ
jgi:hypothetical protein